MSNPSKLSSASAVAVLVVAFAANASDRARLLRWTYPEPPPVGAYWVASFDGEEREVYGATELEGTFYGFAFLPIAWTGTATLRAAIVDADGFEVLSAASNAVALPNCRDADLNGDGIVGGPDFALFRIEFGGICAPGF